jgi:hypothetical protein
MEGVEGDWGGWEWGWGQLEPTSTRCPTCLNRVKCHAKPQSEPRSLPCNLRVSRDRRLDVEHRFVPWEVVTRHQLHRLAAYDPHT